MRTSPDVVVLGAGIVGVACALELRRRGRVVTLVDRRPPGQETSYGNAGVLARSSLMPFNSPALLASLPALVGGRSNGLRCRPTQLLRHLPWSLRFLWHARRPVFESTLSALDGLIRLSIAEHRRLLAEAGALDRLRDTGWLLLYRSEAGHAAAALARSTYARFGIATTELDGPALRELEPALAPVFARGTWIRDALSVDDPGAVVQAYAARFTQQGGTLLQHEVTGLEATAGGWTLRCRDGRLLHARQVVVALGPWSPPLLAGVGLKLPLATERGYHLHYAMTGAAPLQRPFHDAAAGYVIAPMGKRLRLSTGVELAAPDAPPDRTQLERAEQAARQALALGPRLDAEPWLGRRPTLPDSRPMIGEASGRPGLWLALGHQHIGLCTGPGTARLLAAMMCGDPPPIDPAPFDPGRFG